MKIFSTALPYGPRGIAPSQGNLRTVHLGPPKDGFTPSPRFGRLNLREKLQQKVQSDFMVRATRGDGRRLKLLLLTGLVTVNKKNDQGNTALMLAASGGHLDIVKTLIKKGADVLAVNSEGRTALPLAIQSGKWEVVPLLYQATLQTQQPQPSPEPLPLLPPSTWMKDHFSFGTLVNKLWEDYGPEHQGEAFIEGKIQENSPLLKVFQSLSRCIPDDGTTVIWAFPQPKPNQHTHVIKCSKTNLGELKVQYSDNETHLGEKEKATHIRETLRLNLENHTYQRESMQEIEGKIHAFPSEFRNAFYLMLNELYRCLLLANEQVVSAGQAGTPSEHKGPLVRVRTPSAQEKVQELRHGLTVEQLGLLKSIMEAFGEWDTPQEAWLEKALALNAQSKKIFSGSPASNSA